MSVRTMPDGRNVEITFRLPVELYDEFHKMQHEKLGPDHSPETRLERWIAWRLQAEINEWRFGTD